MQTHTTIMRNGKKELPDSETSINALDLALKEKFLPQTCYAGRIKQSVSEERIICK
ncbi:hypothetical protein QNI19_06385 [Cytophagaceae bacterium DM2B3-1]|uniref:Uncharacterized protein n=1 Tax=Xanthocytophaga flava TaxID=3048013 RepID=A0ABT7CFN7_9BACT|nr:hypothetical protein [Xanthocytophaga flavus]MDJ1466553.1 hypothetical protein [Xanthocytophaga flavus]MDJ1492551.1 hypothetical protein [Xanthocytophaga flavus]